MSTNTVADSQSGAIAQAGGDSATAGVQAATSFEELVQAMYAARDAHEAISAHAEMLYRMSPFRFDWEQAWIASLSASGRRALAERAVISHLYAARPR